ncbi:hypothetical protein [Bacillus timonensis]|uniref:hypothetical protein n=1 Tax=Bacillus timonensis TaxID=1033734 RepID=UPI0002D7815D|nr:hypothetical protein [Bacillus timonensis]
MERNINYSELEYICSLMYETYRIPIQIIDENSGVLFNLPSAMVQNPIFNNHLEVYNLLNKSIQVPNFPIFTSTNFLENYFSIQLVAEASKKYIIIVGPSLQSIVTEDTIQSIKQDLNLFINSSKLLSYYKSLPVVPKKRLIHASIHFIYVLTYEKLDEDEIVEKNHSFVSTPISIKSEQITLLERRKNILFHHNLSYEKRLFQAVKDGRKDEVVKILNLPPAEGEYGVLSKKVSFETKKT